MRIKHVFIACIAILLVACSDPKSTALPDDLSKLETVKPEFDKLKLEDKQLVIGYLARRSVAKILPNLEKNTVLTATTFGQAIDQQKDFVAKIANRDVEDKTGNKKNKLEQETAVKAMRDIVSVGLVHKAIVPKFGDSGIELDRNLEVSFNFINKSLKDIDGVKGRITALDQFGDEISSFQISVDDGIKAGSAFIWRGERSVKYAHSIHNKDEKLASLPDNKITLSWSPQVIIFADGTKSIAP